MEHFLVDSKRFAIGHVLVRLVLYIESSYYMFLETVQ